MSTGWARRLQVAAACALIVAYAGLSHYCNASRSHELGAALAMAPLTMLSLVLAWRNTPRAIAALLTMGVAAALYFIWPLFERHYSLVYLTQETLAYGLLGLTFGRSLFGNRAALCTHLADRLHGPLSPREVSYTRRVTAAWALFFFAICTASVTLYILAPLRIWSIYINFCVLPLVGVMFLLEYLVRRRVLPQVARAGLVATVRVYFANP